MRTPSLASSRHRGARALVGLALGLAALLALLAPRAPAAAQAPAAAVLTLVAADGSLWALPEGQAPVRLRRDVARGATVTALAWHPTRPELLLVRLAWRGQAPAGEPWDTLVRLDLASGAEAVLYPEVGPQARLLHPQYAPDGTWAVATIGCCASYYLLIFDGPEPRREPAHTFLPAPADVTLAEPGPFVPDGRMLMAVSCCLGPAPADDPSGVYLVARDQRGAERLTRGQPGTPLGLGPGGAWLAQLVRPPTGTWETINLVVTDLPGGAERTLVAADALPLAEAGAVAPDGRIAVATRQSEFFPPTFAGLWVVEATGARREATGGAFPGFTAFAWAPASVLAALPPGD